MATTLIAILLVPVILFFSKLTLYSFSVFSFLIGYTTLTLATVFIYLFSVFVTKGMAGTILFTKIFGRFAPKIAQLRFLMLFLGALVYVLLRSIPFLGAIIGFWLSLLGLGALWIVGNDNRKARKISSKSMEPVIGLVEAEEEPVNQDEPETVISEIPDAAELSDKLEKPEDE